MRYFLYTILFCLGACEPITAPRGNLLSPIEIKQLKIGKTSSDEVLHLCGSPSFFKDQHTWIYVGGIGQEKPMRLHKIPQKIVIILSFNNSGILKNIDIKKSNIEKNFDFSDSIHLSEKY